MRSAPRADNLPWHPQIKREQCSGPGPGTDAPNPTSEPVSPPTSLPVAKLASTRSISGGSLPPARQMPGMIVESPSFRPTRPRETTQSSAGRGPAQGAPFHSVILESPSFASPGASPSSLSASSTVIGTPVSGPPSSTVPAPSPTVPRTPMRAGVVERKPPPVLKPSVREAASSSSDAGQSAERKPKVSRFRAERS